MKFPKELLAILLTGCGLGIILFSRWQLDIMFVSKMWGSCEGNIAFYQSLIDCGWHSFAESDWFTINVTLFPRGMFNSGFWYDFLMGIPFIGWFLTVVGAYYLPHTVKFIRKKLYRLIRER